VLALLLLLTSESARSSLAIVALTLALFLSCVARVSPAVAEATSRFLEQDWEGAGKFLDDVVRGLVTITITVTVIVTITITVTVIVTITITVTVTVTVTITVTVTVTITVTITVTVTVTITVTIRNSAGNFLDGLVRG